MPQNTGRILQDSHINRDHSGTTLNRWAVVTGSRLEQRAELTETGETPVTLIGCESMMGVYEGGL